MADGVNLFDLASRITADTAAHDRALTESQKKVLALAAEHQALDSKSSTAFKSVGQSAQKLSSELSNTTKEGSKLAEGLRVIASSAVVAEGPMGGISSRIRALATDTGEVSGLLGPEGVIVLGLAAIAAGAVAAGISLFELTKHAAEYGDEIFKAEQKSGLSAGALSTLKVIATETGTSFEGLTTSAARLQVAISKGITIPTSEAGKALQLLKLNTEAFTKASPDRQLSMTAKALEDVTNQADKNRAAQALLSRGWLQSADAIRAIAEEFDGAQKKADQFGLMMSEDDVKAAHEFEVAVKDLLLQFEGFGLQVGTKILPEVQGALVDLNNALFSSTGLLGEGRSAWDAWGDIALATVISVRAAFSGLLTLIATGNASLAGTVAQMRIDSSLDSMPSNQVGVGMSMGMGGPVRPEFRSPSGSEFPGGGRGGGGKGRGAKQGIDEVTAALQKQNEQITEAWNRTDKYQKTIDQLVLSLAKKHKALTDDQLKQLEANAATLAGIDMLHSWNDFLRSQEREIQDARLGTDQYTKAIRTWMDSERAAGRAVSDDQILIAKRNAEVERELALTRQRIVLAQTLTDRLERQRYVEDKNFPASVGIQIDQNGTTRARRVSDLSDDTKAKLHQLAGDITNTLDNAIRTGFEQGAKEGFRALALGFLQTLEQMATDWLASSIFKMLSGAASSNAGGSQGGIFGWLLKAIGIVGPALGGAAGGGGGSPVPYTIPPLAGGMSYVPYDNFLARLHKGERVMTAAENKQGGGHTFNVSFVIQGVQDARSFMSEDTQRQMSQKAQRMLQHAALTG